MTIIDKSRRMPFADIKRGAEDIGQELDDAIARFKGSATHSRDDVDKALDALDKDLESVRQDVRHYRYGKEY